MKNKFKKSMITVLAITSAFITADLLGLGEDIFANKKIPSKVETETSMVDPVKEMISTEAVTEITFSESSTDIDLNNLENARVSLLAEIAADDTAIAAQNFISGKIPIYSGDYYTEINDNLPYFSKEEYSSDSYEFYSDLDTLGRAGEAIACIGPDLMPTEKRGEIGMIKPSGWVQNKYDWVDGKYLYNRCHLIGYQLTGENANEKNLITGTRTFNVEGMLPFENEVASYIHETKNHVMYKVTPVYDGTNLLAEGVQMQAISIEDGGYGVCFNVFVYNVEPRVEIDYTDGNNWAEK